MRSNATYRLGVSYILRGEKKDLSVDERFAERKTMCIQEHERSARWKGKAECSDVQTFNPEHLSWVPSVVF